jgi:competence protein ComEC
MGSRTTALALALVVLLAGCAAPVSDGPGSAADGGDATVTTADAPNGTVEVHFVNVGQSVATLVVGPTGETMLVDSGHYNDDGEHVLAYLQRHGIDRIDYLVTSHNDADHIGGNAAVIDHYETEADGVGAVYDPGVAASTQTYGDYLDAVERHGVTLFETRAGDTIPMEGVTVDVFGPPDPYIEGKARNENSIVLKLTFGATSFLLTGDAEDDQEAWLVDEYGDRLQATVLKAGHHGSKSSTSSGLLDDVDPQVTVVSSAYDSRYGHPHEEVLGRLEARDVPTYWTATHGDVVFESDGRAVRVKTQADAPTDPGRLREGDPVAPGTTDDVQPRAVVEARGELATVDATATATDGSTDGTATDGGTAGDLRLVEVNADAEGDDRENLNDEYVVLANDGDGPLELSGWTLADEAGHTYTFPDGFTLAAGEQVTVHTGSGTDTATDLYWGAGSPVWNNAGDTVVVRDASGEVVLREGY